MHEGRVSNLALYCVTTAGLDIARLNRNNTLQNFCVVPQVNMKAYTWRALLGPFFIVDWAMSEDSSWTSCRAVDEVACTWQSSIYIHVRNNVHSYATTDLSVYRIMHLVTWRGNKINSGVIGHLGLQPFREKVHQLLQKVEDFAALILQISYPEHAAWP